MLCVLRANWLGLVSVQGLELRSLSMLGKCSSGGSVSYWAGEAHGGAVQAGGKVQLYPSFWTCFFPLLFFNKTSGQFLHPLNMPKNGLPLCEPDSYSRGKVKLLDRNGREQVANLPLFRVRTRGRWSHGIFYLLN